MSECVVCAASVQSRSVKIACSECKRICHGGCVNMSKADIECLVTDKQVWRCPPCAKARRRSMSAVSAAQEGTASISDVIFMLEEAKEDRKRIESQFNASFEFTHGKIEDQSKLIEEQSKKIEECLKHIEGVTAENNQLRDKVKKLEARLEEVEQYTRANSVEIFGVPEERGEDTYAVVQKVCAALDFNIERVQIDVCHRLGKPRDSGRPAGIIAKFVRRDDKLNLLAKRKVKRNFSTQNLGYAHPAVPIYINDSLSPERKKLYAAAREVKKEKGYTYLWVQSGKILMRKEQGTPVCRISSMDDFNKL